MDLIHVAGKAMHAQTYTIRTIPVESTDEVGENEVDVS